jgi:hypothetical protein
MSALKKAFDDGEAVDVSASTRWSYSHAKAQAMLRVRIADRLPSLRCGSKHRADVHLVNLYEEQLANLEGRTPHPPISADDWAARNAACRSTRDVWGG